MFLYSKERIVQMYKMCTYTVHKFNEDHLKYN